MPIKAKQLDTSGILERDADPTLSANLDVVDKVITTATTNGNVKLEPNGSGAIEIRGASSNDGVLQLNCSDNSHGVKIKSPPHSAAANYTLILPDNIGTNGQVLQTNGVDKVSWVDHSATSAGTLVYKGSYDVASSGTTGLQNAVKGDFYIASTEGSLSGLLVRKGDHIVVNADMGGAFNKLKIDLIDNTGPYQEYLGLSQSSALTAKVGHFYAFNSSVNTSTELILPNSADLTTGDTFKVINNSTTQNDGTVTIIITGGSGKPGLISYNPVQGFLFSPGSASSVNIEVKGQALTFIYDQSNDSFYLETGTRFLEALVDVDTTTTSPSNGDFLKYDGTNWIPGAASGGPRPTVTTDNSATNTIISDPSASVLEDIYLIDNGSTAVTITLPTVTGNSGYKVQIKRLGTANVTISRAGTATIDDGSSTTTVLTIQYSSLTLCTDGTDWYII